MSNIPRRQGPKGRTAQLRKRLKALPARTNNVQGHHNSFRKSRYSAILLAPADGVVYGYIKLKELIGHATCLIKFEEGSNIEMPVRDGKTKFPKTAVKGGDMVKIYIKPLEDTATVKHISIGVMFKETK